MKTIIKQSADGLILSRDNNFDTKLRKVFINNHEITDIDTFFKVAEENTRLLEQVKKQKEVIDKAKSLNHEISHIIYEDFLEENIIGSKFLYERIKKQLSILEDKEVSK